MSKTKLAGLNLLIPENMLFLAIVWFVRLYGKMDGLSGQMHEIYSNNMLRPAKPQISLRICAV